VKIPYAVFILQIDIIERILMKKRGFTLVEALIVLAIVGILLALLLPIVLQLFSGSSTIQDARVIKAEAVYERVGSFGETKYLVFTDKGAFAVKPSIYGIVQVGKVYDVEAYGWEPMTATKFVLDVNATEKVEENEH
jgi:prepilin-type N-terminal cleavage/methylation domain-containing protein